MGQEQSQLAGEAQEDDNGEFPELSAVNTPIESSAISTEGDWNYLDTANKIRALNKGITFFTFSCKLGNLMSEEERRLIDLIINQTCFEDEATTNNVPIVNIMDDDEASKYSIILVKTAYMLPRAKIEQFTPEFLSTPEYHTSCEPGNPVVWDETPDSSTFRLTKTVIPYVYDLTIQMKVSKIEGENLEKLTEIDDLKPSHALLMERTKRNPQVVDATRKCKSTLIYYEVPGGVLCVNLTAVLNTFLPAFIVPFIDSLGYYGTQEACDTARLTRTYLRDIEESPAKPSASKGDKSEYQDTATPVPSEIPSQLGKGEEVEVEEEEEVFEDAGDEEK